MTTQDKLALGLSHGMPSARWGLCTDYAALVASWRDPDPVPSEAQILAWFSEWEAAQPTEASAIVISRAQFGEMMIRKGIKTSVEAVLDAISDPTAKTIMREWYEYTPTVRRNAPKVEEIRQTLGISAADADAWFTEAAQYE